MKRKKTVLTLGIVAVISIAGTVYAIDANQPVILPAIEVVSSPTPTTHVIKPIAAPTIPAYSSIKDRMLNAVDNYNTIQGTFRVVFSNINLDQTIVFNVSEGNSPGSYVKTTNNITQDSEEVSSDGSSLLTLYNKTQKFMKASTTKAETGNIKGPRQSKTANGDPVYIYRADPAFSNAAQDVIFPQTYAFWLNDETHNYKVTGNDTLLGRTVTLIEGTLDDQMAKKHKAAQFKMWVDSETGALLKMEETNVKGEVINSINVTSITFNEDADHTKFTTAIPKGYTDNHTR